MLSTECDCANTLRSLSQTDTGISQRLSLLISAYCTLLTPTWCTWLGSCYSGQVWSYRDSPSHTSGRRQTRTCRAAWAACVARGRTWRVVQPHDEWSCHIGETRSALHRTAAESPAAPVYTETVDNTTLYLYCRIDSKLSLRSTKYS